MVKHLADYTSTPITFTKGDGCYLINKNGKRYLDFIASWCTGTVGWRNKEMAEAISAQAKEGVSIPPLFRDPKQEEFASLLCSLAPGKLTRAIRCTSGSEAVEFAIKCARAATDKPCIISIDEVYHGHTYGAASVGEAAQRGTMGPALDGFLKIPLPRRHSEEAKTISAFERLLKSQNDIAAFMSEPVWTNAGCFIPSPNFYQTIERLCRKHDVLFVMDEVATGMGRCGRMFASTLWNLTPDIICLGKSLTGGYATMGATLITENIFKKSRGIPAYSTFGWLQQDLAATRKNVEIILQDKLDKNASEVGSYLLDLLKPLESLKKVREVRGVGMVFAIEFTMPIAPLMALRCYRAGLLVAFTDAKTLFFSPPLILNKKLALEGANILKRVCGIR